MTNLLLYRNIAVLTRPKAHRLPAGRGATDGNITVYLAGHKNLPAGRSQKPGRGMALANERGRDVNHRRQEVGTKRVRLGCDELASGNSKHQDVVSRRLDLRCGSRQVGRLCQQCCTLELWLPLTAKRSGSKDSGLFYFDEIPAGFAAPGDYISDRAAWYSRENTLTQEVCAAFSSAILHLLFATFRLRVNSRSQS
ncbi:MAG: hypothetical protein ONB48_06055 [candidate division KSB1 bacterium]|nr:hypothetical protein [candidate division KSB1 bacterium]MDZ7273110.1 hypothetical protein [candidate division KSB1 bacterium]MDZ7285212.1 hypothetical protein [candidate division KSB1 bacterium]MDZ7298244.1 hypothetical protein [candidate division KSB1 bacterium]MDZ7309194.1 hypothetical protein [candidate division KSB1 bacterium]